MAGKTTWAAWWGRTVSVRPGRKGRDQGHMVVASVTADDGRPAGRPVDLYLTPREAEALARRLMQYADAARGARVARREAETF